MPYVSPGVTQGSKPYVGTGNSQRIAPSFGAISAKSYAGCVEGMHQTSSLVSTPAGAWRAPLPYRCFAGRVYPQEFDYTYSVSATTKYRAWGYTDTRLGYGPPNYITWGTKVSGSLIVPDVSQNMIDRSITEALNKFTDEKLNAAVALAEAKKTYSQLCDLISRIARSALQIKKGNIVQGIRILTGTKPGKNLNKANLYLEYQYGILPLLYDVKGLVELLDRGLRKDGHHIKAHRRLSTSIALPPNPNSSTYKEWKTTGKARVGAETIIYGRITNQYLDLMNTIGSFNPLSVIWELIPFSFVLDWIIPVGNVLSALSASVGVQHLGSFTNTKSWCTFRIECCKQYSEPGDKIPSVLISNVCQKREAHVNMPLPRFYIKSPFSNSHSISAIALLSQLKR